MVGSTGKGLRQIQFSALLNNTRVGLAYTFCHWRAKLGPRFYSTACVFDNFRTITRIHTKVIASWSLVHLLCITHRLPCMIFFVNLVIIDVLYCFLLFFYLAVLELNHFIVCKNVLEAIWRDWADYSVQLLLETLVVLLVLWKRDHHLYIRLAASRWWSGLKVWSASVQRSVHSNETRIVIAEEAIITWLMQTVRSLVANTLVMLLNRQLLVRGSFHCTFFVIKVVDDMYVSLNWSQRVLFLMPWILSRWAMSLLDVLATPCQIIMLNKVIQAERAYLSNHLWFCYSLDHISMHRLAHVTRDSDWLVHQVWCDWALASLVLF